MKISKVDMANALCNYFRSAPVDVAFRNHCPAFWTGRDFPVKALGYRNYDFAVSIPYVLFEGLNLASIGNASVSLGKIRKDGETVDVLEELAKANAVLQHYFSGVMFELKNHGMYLIQNKIDVTFYPGDKISSLEISAGLIDMFGTSKPNGGLHNYARELKKLNLLT